MKKGHGRMIAPLIYRSLSLSPCIAASLPSYRDHGHHHHHDHDHHRRDEAPCNWRMCSLPLLE